MSIPGTRILHKPGNIAGKVREPLKTDFLKWIIHLFMPHFQWWHSLQLWVCLCTYVLHLESRELVARYQFSVIGSPAPTETAAPALSKPCKSAASFQKHNVERHLNAPLCFEIKMLKMLFLVYWLSSQLLSIAMGSCWWRQIFRYSVSG